MNSMVMAAAMAVMRLRVVTSVATVPVRLSMRFLETGLAHEGKGEKTGHVERSQKRRDHRKKPQELRAMRSGKRLPENFIF